MKKLTTPFRNRRKGHSNRSARRTSNAPMLAGLESIPQPRCFEDNVRLPRSFRPILPGSIFVAPANERRSFRSVFDADKIWVCAQALPNPVEKACGKTRGFTSCLVFLNVGGTATAEGSNYGKTVMAFIQCPAKAARRNLRASGEFCLWAAKARWVQPATLWRGRAIQNQKPNGVAFRFWQESVGSNPNPTGGSAPPTSVASALVGHANVGFAARPDFGDFYSCSGSRTGTLGHWGLSKVRNSELIFRLPTNRKLLETH